MGGGGNGGMKRCQSTNISIQTKRKPQEEEQDFGVLEQTNLFLSTGAATKEQEAQQQRLYLPRHDTAPCSLDVYLKSIPAVASRTELFFQQHPQEGQEDALRKAASSQKCLTVLQGEVAHASETDTDLLVSAEATTCHVVALRSTHNSNTSSQAPALASMAHVDQADVYEHCLEKMVQEHIQHHLAQAREDNDDDDFGFFMGDESDNDDDDDDDKSLIHHHEPQHASNKPRGHQRTPSFLPQPNFGASERPTKVKSMPTLTKPVEMELHIAGGYLDEDGTSQGLSTSLVHSFSKLADKYQDQIRISLSTAAISSMNHDTSQHGGPRSRGLALNTHTGEVTPVTTALPDALEGPAMELRNARLWSNDRLASSQQPELAVIHTSQSNGNIIIDPFQYEPQPQLNALLRVPDPVLLQVTSTSPQHESERFCNDLRRTLSFVNTVPSHHVFGDGGDHEDNNKRKPLVYSRSSHALNEWEPVVAVA